MTIDEMFKWVNFVANKSQSGAISPDEFNLACSVVNIEFLKLKIGLPEEYQVGSPMARQMYQVSQKITDDVKFLITKLPINKSLDYFAIPSDYAAYSKLTYRYIENVECKSVLSTRPIEVVTDSEYAERIDNSITYPTFKNPIANYTSYGLEVSPQEIDKIELTYLKIPATPFRNYTINANDESVYSASGAGAVYPGIPSVNFAFPVTTHNDICMRLLGYFGINVREEFLVQTANSYKQNGQ